MSKAKSKFGFEELFDTAPKEFDPENVEFDGTSARLQQYDDEDLDLTGLTARSQLRTRAANIVPTRKGYGGKVVSRADLSDFEEDELSGSDIEENENQEEVSDEEVGGVGRVSGDESEEMDYESDAAEVQKLPSMMSNTKKFKEAEALDRQLQKLEAEEMENRGEDIEGVDIMKDKRLEDANKAQHTRQQRTMWDTALAIRIKQQKCLLTSNSFPDQATLLGFEGLDSRIGSEMGSIQLDLYTLTKDLYDLQYQLRHKEDSCIAELMSEKYTSDPALVLHDGDEGKEKDGKKRKRTRGSQAETLAKRAKIEEQNVVVGEEKLAALWRAIEADQKAFIPVEEAIISKWNKKALTKNNFRSMNQSILAQIEGLLKDEERLVKRTQLVRGNVSVPGVRLRKEKNGEAKEKEYNNEIFDDSDFYSQLLKDFISLSTVDVTDPMALSKAYLARRDATVKHRKKVDRKASKNRKLRYNVHEKLLNFMAPVDEDAEVPEGLLTHLFEK